MDTSSQVTVCKNILLKYIDLPAVRFIGKDVIARGKIQIKNMANYGGIWRIHANFG